MTKGEKRRVLVTGSSGFIGRWTCGELVRRGYSVHGFDLNRPRFSLENFDFTIGNILDRDLLMETFAKFRPVFIIHLAARVDLDGRCDKDYLANSTGVKNICHAISTTSTVGRAVFASSQLVCSIGTLPDSDEDYCPPNPYGSSKVKSERVVRAESGGGVPWCIVRPTTVWGPYMSSHYKSFLDHLAKRRYVHPGGRAHYKSYSYVGNAAYQLCQLLECNEEVIAGKVFYLADYEPISLRSYCDSLAVAMGCSRPLTVPLPLLRIAARFGDLLSLLGIAFPLTSFRLKNICTEYIFDMRKTESVCGSLPYSFEDGIAATAKWYTTL